MERSRTWSIALIVFVSILILSGLACGRGGRVTPTVWISTAVPAQPPAQQPPAEQHPAEQPPVEQPPAQQPPAEQPPAEQPPEEPPAGSGLPVIDYFYAEGSANAGCFYLHWDLHGATAAYLNGEGITAPGSAEVCPEASATYVLRAENAVGSVEETVSVEKSSPPEPPLPVPVGQADLVLIDARLEPVLATSGQPFAAIFAVENQGDAASGPFTVFWQFHAVTGLKNCCSLEYPDGLAPGGQVGGIFRDLVSTAQAGSSPTWVEVDYGNQVPESEAGEANNRVSFDFLLVDAEPAVPASPTNLRLAAFAPVGQIGLEWDHDSANVERFRVRLVGVNWAGETGPGVTGITLPAPPCNETHRYRVSACNAVGCSEPSNTLEVTGSCN